VLDAESAAVRVFAAATVGVSVVEVSVTVGPVAVRTVMVPVELVEA
jgi:hypothetical protein